MKYVTNILTYSESFAHGFTHGGTRRPKALSLVAGTFGLSRSFQFLTHHREPISLFRRVVLFTNLNSRAQIPFCLKTKHVTLVHSRGAMRALQTPAPLYIWTQRWYPIALFSHTRTITRFQSALGTSLRAGSLKDRFKHLTARRRSGVGWRIPAADPLLYRWGDFGASEFGQRCSCVWWKGQVGTSGGTSSRLGWRQRRGSLGHGAFGWSDSNRAERALGDNKEKWEQWHEFEQKSKSMICSSLKVYIKTFHAGQNESQCPSRLCS